MSIKRLLIQPDALGRLLLHVTKHVACNPANLNFLCTFRDAIPAMMPIDVFKRLVPGIPQAAMNLHRLISRLAAQTIRLIITHRHLVGDRKIAIGIHHPSGLVNQGPQHLTSRLKFRQGKLDGLITR